MKPSENKKPVATPKERLPVWNLSLIFNGLHSQEFTRETEELEERVYAFAEEHENRVNQLSGAELGAAIEEYEYLSGKLQRVQGYLDLMVSENRNNYSKTKQMSAWGLEMGAYLSFFEAEICKMREGDLLARTAAPELAQYAPWLGKLRSGRHHDMNPKVEGLANELDHANGSALTRLYNQLMVSLKFTLNGETIGSEEISDRTRTGNEEERRLARAEAARVYKENGPLFAHILNTIMREKAIDDKWRGFARPDDNANAQNQIETELMDQMGEAVKSSYGRLAHRYFAWRAQKGEQDRIHIADISGEASRAGGLISWSDATDMTLRAFRRFSPQFARIAKRFIEDGYIHAAPTPNKDNGGFAQPLGPEEHPFILINYRGGPDDVATLAHEIGHGIHFILAERAQGHLMATVSDPVAETASVFGEMLAFEEMLFREKDPEARKTLLSEKIYNMIHTTHCQMSWHDFECRLHEERKNGELDVEQISDIWMNTQKEYFGPAVEMDDYRRYYWMTISHFYEMPFYVSSYVFAQMLVSALYETYKEQEDPAEFSRKYIAFLETGLSKNLMDSLKEFDLDPREPEFWEKGLSLIEKYQDELEAPIPAPTKPSSKSKPTKTKLAPKSPRP